jgi:hypothetical protein
MLTLLNPHRFPPPFQPNDIAGLAQWFDPSDPDSVTLDGSDVSQLADKSGNGDHATQPTVSERPLLGAINGRTALSFSGTNEELNLPDPDSITGSQNRSLFVVFQNADLNDNQSMISYGRSSNESSFHLASRTSNSLRLGTWPSFYDTSNLMPGTVAHIAGVILDGTTVNDCTLYLDGTSEQVTGVPATVNTQAIGTARIGSVHGVDDMHGLIGEVLLYDSALSAADRWRIEGYLAHRWGLQVQLPAGHPYKSTPP